MKKILYFLIMSIFSSLFGCGKPVDKFADVPQFPATNNPNCRVTPIVMDSDFFVQNFIISPDKKTIILYVWYDNEYGYTRQVIRFSKHISEVRRPVYY